MFSYGDYTFNVGTANISGTIGDPRMVIQQGGNVGIGTTSPGAKLHVEESTANTPVAVKIEAASWDSAIELKNGNGSWEILNDYSGLGTVSTLGFYSGGYRMVIGNSGNVGIGTTGPTARLDVRGSNRIYSTQSASTWIQGNGGGLNYGMDFFLTNDVGATQKAVRLRTAYGGIGTAGFPNFSISRATTDQSYSQNPDSLTYVESLVIDGSNGNVGIGITNPQSKVDVLQEMRVSFAQSNEYRTRITNTDGNSQILADGNDAHLIFGTSAGTTGATATEKMRIDSSGTVLIGKTSSSNAPAGIILLKDGTSGGVLKLTRVVNTGATQYNVIFFNSGGGAVGSISTTESSTAYNTSSDYRLKEDLKDFNGLDMVSNIPVYDYKWKVDESRSYGVMAHELQEVLPQAVVGEKDAEEMQSVDYSKIVPVLIKAIQELTAKVAILEQK